LGATAEHQKWSDAGDHRRRERARLEARARDAGAALATHELSAAQWPRPKAVDDRGFHEQKKLIACPRYRDEKLAQRKACPAASSAQDTPDARISRNLTARLHCREGENPFPTKKIKPGFSNNRHVDAAIGLS
jgi:hypothetical protein